MVSKISIIICFLALFSCSQSNDEYKIEIHSSEFNNMSVKLIRVTDEGIKILDSTKFEMSTAHFKGKITNPELMYIFVDGNQDYLPIFIENEKIIVDLNANKLNKSTIEGSECNKIFTDFLLSYSSYNDKANGLNKMLTSAHENNDTLIIKNLEQSKKDLNLEMIGFQRQFIGKYISSPVACYILSSHLMYNLNKQELSQLLDSIPASNRENKYYFRAKEYCEILKDTI